MRLPSDPRNGGLRPPVVRGPSHDKTALCETNSHKFLVSESVQWL